MSSVIYYFEVFNRKSALPAGSVGFERSGRQSSNERCWVALWDMVRIQCFWSLIHTEEEKSRYLSLCCCSLLSIPQLCGSTSLSCHGELVLIIKLLPLWRNGLLWQILCLKVWPVFFKFFIWWYCFGAFPLTLPELAALWHLFPFFLLSQQTPLSNTKHQQYLFIHGSWVHKHKEIYRQTECQTADNRQSPERRSWLTAGSRDRQITPAREKRCPFRVLLLLLLRHKQLFTFHPPALCATC